MVCADGSLANRDPGDFVGTTLKSDFLGPNPELEAVHVARPSEERLYSGVIFEVSRIEAQGEKPWMFYPTPGSSKTLGRDGSETKRADAPLVIQVADYQEQQVGSDVFVRTVKGRPISSLSFEPRQ